MTIDLSSLPAPEIVESLSYEKILAEIKSDFLIRYPEFSQVIELESDPAVKLLEVAAYRELVLRARINDAAKAVMISYANGSNLEHLSALFGVVRLENESDERLRTRAQLAPEGFSTAGPEGAYVYHTLSSSSEVADVYVDSPSPGEVRVTILSSSGDGTASDALLNNIETRLSSEDVRPITDHVSVESAEIIPYVISAVVHCYPGPSPAPVVEAVQAKITNYISTQRRLGRDITLSGIYAALHQPGVQRIDLLFPTQNIVIGKRQAGHCTALDISIGESDV